jgi:hypothetical protein
MHSFSEELLQFIWRHRLLKPGPLRSVKGAAIEIIKPGDLNTDSGPDFFNGQVSVDGIVLAGNIEIHIRTSDWLRHGHQQDLNYDNIILHVVYEHDLELAQNERFSVEVLELRDHIEPLTLQTYTHLASAPGRIPCSKQITGIDDMKVSSWLERMTIERLEKKVEKLGEIFEAFKGDYTQSLYTLLLRNFGFKVNSLPFELVARQLPVQLLLRHSDNLVQLEALLLGIAGMLDDQFTDQYIRDLQNEFEFLKRKYSLVPLKKEIFKFSRMRPANFPGLRLVQFAGLIHSHREIVQNPIGNYSYELLTAAIRSELSEYWKYHYKPDGKISESELRLGKDSADNVLVNTFAPFYFFYAKRSGKREFEDLALNLLERCAYENNQKTRLFPLQSELLGSAARSQALINLYDNYCSRKKCLSCGIGAALLSAPRTVASV